MREFLPKVKADLAYFDPPYVTEFSAANYSANYRAVDAVMVKSNAFYSRMQFTLAELSTAFSTELLREISAHIVFSSRMDDRDA